METNFLAILACGVVAMIVGMVWHSKALFGDKYMKAIGADTNMSPEKIKEIQKDMWQLYVTQFALALFQAYVLSGYIISEPAVGGSLNAIWIWAGFVMPTIAGAAMWSARPRKMAWQIFLISSGYHLVLFILFGMILKAWI
jgi:hypothetical protein